MNFILNDRSIEFILTDELEFQLNDNRIEFNINAITEPSGNFRLLEDSFYRLLESGFKRLLE